MHDYRNILSQYLGYTIKTATISSTEPSRTETDPLVLDDNNEIVYEELQVEQFDTHANMADLPSGYHTLDQAKSVLHKKVEVIGIVHAFDPPARSKGTDFHLTIHLRDPTLYGGPEPESMKVKFFKKRIEEFPPVKNVGDVMILKGLKQLRLGGPGSMFVDAYDTIVLVFAYNAIPQSLLSNDIASLSLRYPELQHETNKGRPLSITYGEKNYIIYLWKWLQEEHVKFPPSAIRKHVESAAPTGPLSNTVFVVVQKQALLSQLQSNNFYDLTVEVVRVLRNYDKTTLYVTDYTTNALFYDYGNEDELNELQPAYIEEESTGKRIWKGPAGKSALQITLWPPHSDFVNENVQEGNIVNLRNVNIQPNRNAMNIIEGKLHTDRRYEERVDVTVARESSGPYQSLIARKDAYWKKNLPVGLKSADNTDNSKAKSKAQKKKEKKAERKRQAEEMEKKAASMDVFTTAGTSSINTHIATGHEDKAPQPIHSILNSAHLYGKTPEGDHITYPFMNAVFRTQARVVDFYPPKLEDFAHSLDDDGYNDCPDPEDASTMDIDGTPSSRWEWAFWLLLEDTKKNSTGQHERIKVLVAGLDADYLLKLDACNLRQEGQVLLDLREKLFLLWGEVEEKKQRNEVDTNKPPNNKPFDCCIQEYGIPDGHGGWTRLHRMFHTVIQ